MTLDDQRRLASERAARQLAEKLKKIAGQAVAVRSTGVAIPEVEEQLAADDPSNLWLFADGRLFSRTSDGLVHEYDLYDANERPSIPTFASDPAASTGWAIWVNGSTGQLRVRMANGTVQSYAPVVANSSTDGGTPATKPATSTVTKPADPVVKRYSKEYAATWGRAFCTVHGVETGDELNYGSYSASVHGERKIMFGFNHAAIASDLAGSTVRSVELQMRNTHSWANAGVEIYFGAHMQSSAPGAYSATRENIWHNGWPKVGYGGGADRWRPSTVWIGTSFKAGTIRGLTVNQPSNSNAYYGELEWQSLRLRIVYTK